jgi:hypothetical protein
LNLNQECFGGIAGRFPKKGTPGSKYCCQYNQRGRREGVKYLSGLEDIESQQLAAWSQSTASETKLSAAD